MGKEQELLKRCPFCGAPAKSIYTEIPLSKWRYRIACSSTTCGADGSSEDSMVSAIAAWNRRSSSDEADEAKLSSGPSDDSKPAVAYKASDEAEVVGWQHRKKLKWHTEWDMWADGKDIGINTIDFDWEVRPLYASPSGVNAGVTEAQVEAALAFWCSKLSKAQREQPIPDKLREHMRETLRAALAVHDEGMGEVLRDALRFISDIDNAHPVVGRLRALLRRGDATDA